MPEFSDLFRHFFWLIFPIFGMIMGLLHMNQRHDQSLKVLDMIKSYADQGKAPPPELLEALRQANLGTASKSEPNWIPVLLFGALAGGFAAFALVEGRDLHHLLPFAFVALIMAAMAIGFLVNLLTARSRNGAPRA